MKVIEGVEIKTLRLIADERGYLMEMFRCDDPIFEKFGQSYLTTCYPGVVKAWHYHKIQSDNFVCVKGMIKLALFDNREDSKTYKLVNEFFMGEKNLILIHIPPFVYHGFKAIGTEMAMIINHPTHPYNYQNPDEYRLPYNTEEIPYDWDIKMG